MHFSHVSTTFRSASIFALSALNVLSLPRHSCSFRTALHLSSSTRRGAVKKRLLSIHHQRVSTAMAATKAATVGGGDTNTSRSAPANGLRCPPAEIGDRLSDVDTPALVVDMDAFERNLSSMRGWVEAHNRERSRRRGDGGEGDEERGRLRLRPHAKTHKTAEVALLLIEKGGAEGICVQKLDEAAAMVEGGITDIFLTNEVVGKKKIDRFVSLAAHENNPKLSILVDDVNNVHNVAAVIEANSSPVQVGVFIEVNGGQDRCGVSSDDATKIMELYEAIQSHSSAMSFKGIHCYGGGLQHVRSREDRRAKVFSEPVAAAKKARDALAQHGVFCDVITGGGTGTFQFEAEAGVHNEIQPGSYIFMDVDYCVNEDGKDMFENALFVHTSVVSTAVRRGQRTVVDAGMKAVSLDSGPPSLPVADVNFGLHSFVDKSISYECGGDEHGILIHHDEDGKLEVGDTLRMIPGHIDPTVNMHDWLVCMRRSSEAGDEPVVSNVWRIGGRGPGL